jgi:hypothetical protein
MVKSIRDVGMELEGYEMFKLWKEARNNALRRRYRSMMERAFHGFKGRCWPGVKEVILRSFSEAMK